MTQVREEVRQQRLLGTYQFQILAQYNLLTTTAIRL